MELDVDAVCDGTEVLIGAIMTSRRGEFIQEIQLVLFPQNIQRKFYQVEDWTKKLEFS